MTMIYGHNTPSRQLLESLMAKVNAYGTEPRVLIELDKFSYVPGMKSRFDIVEWVYSSQVNYVSGGEMPVLDEPEEVEGSPEGTERYNYIIQASGEAVQAWGLDETARKFLLAICKHETNYGTTGNGRLRRGSFVLGYGCSSGCDVSYAGIKTQFYYGAKRYKEAMASRLQDIADRGELTYEDVDWFHEGGDKGYGEYVWSTDGVTWKNSVWSIYRQLKDKSFPQSQTFSNNLNMFYASSAVTAIGEEPAFPIAGTKFGSGSQDAVVTSHSSKNPKGTRKNHRGIDISLHGGSSVAYGKDIVACWDGIVRVSDYSPSYGEYVIITHKNGWETLYAHLVKGSRTVSVGQKVRKGQVIGKMGNTGNVSPKPTASKPTAGTHLHFEIWKNGWTYGGDNWIDPYPVLTGAQQISAGGGEVNSDQAMQVIENIKYNKCYHADGTLTEDFIDAEDVSWFTVPTIAKKVIGYKKGDVKQGDHKSFAYRHNFSADGYFEYSIFVDLKEGDTLTVRVDGVPVQIYTHEDSNGTLIYAPPVYLKYNNISQNGANSRILDFHLENYSGDAYFGIACLKVAEVEVIAGTAVIDTDVKQRLIERWHDVGAFVYEETFYIEDDILEWEVNTHFDMQSATARITLNNDKGIYSPSYERTATFPDNLEKSPYSWYENGKLQHIISEATPIRIYAGYGDQLVRVFTGKIKGEIEENSVDRTITFNCVDMYDELEQCVFTRPLSFPPVDHVTGHTDEEPKTMWLKSAIIQAIVHEAGLVGWRYHLDDLMHPDYIIEETYYIDIDKGSRKAVILDEDGKPQEVVIPSEQTIEGYKNPFVETAHFDIGVRASDAIRELIADTMMRAYCNRYGTFVLEHIRTNAPIKWDFIDGDNLISVDSSIDYSRVRNHLMISGAAGTQGRIDHFFDRDLIIALKGNIRTAGIQVDWLDERFGSNARGQKEVVAKRLFFDMKRQARTYNVVVKGNPMIDVMDGCYIYDRNSSTAGYYMIKGNRLVGNQEGMVNFLELTWENTLTSE